MHEIEPYFRWRDQYVAAEDPHSPFFRRQYSEFDYTHQLYNFYLHPQWDSFGSQTLYCKILFADYEEGYALIELIGEWNDTLYNDIMYLKREVVDYLYDKGVVKYVFFCENVLNFHSSNEDDYYAEWAEEVHEEGGWIVLLNVRQHVEEEMHAGGLHRHAHFGRAFNGVNWRAQKPPHVLYVVAQLLSGQTKRLYG